MRSNMTWVICLHLMMHIVHSYQFLLCVCVCVDTICFSHTFPSLWATHARVSLVDTHKLISHPSLSLAVFLSFPLIWRLRRATALCWSSFLPQRSLLHIVKRLCSLCSRKGVVGGWLGGQGGRDGGETGIWDGVMMAGRLVSMSHKAKSFPSRKW